MKRILMVSCEGLGNGGVQAVMMNIVRNLHREYLFDALLFTSEKRYYDDEFSSYGGNIHRIPRYEGSNKYRKKADYYIRGYKLYKDVKRLLIENGPYDVVHCNDEFESALIVKAAAECGVPVRITHTHIISQKSNAVATLLENHRKRMIEKYSNVKVGCSLDACYSFYSYPNDSIVINNTYDDCRFSRIKYLESDSKRLALIQVGSFSPIKNQLFSLDVVNRIKQDYPNVLLRLIGFDMDGYEDLVKRRIKELKLDENVVLYPSNADTPLLLSDSFAFIFPSLHEGFGIVLIEAQAMGVRCFASTGVPQLANCGGVTYLELKDGAEVWANAIMEAYSNNKSTKEIYDVSDFAASTVMEKYRHIYEGARI